jgi:hypothetical protein
MAAVVQQVVQELNVPVRDALRAETGLRLNFQGRQQSVRIRVVLGFPRPLREIAEHQPDASIWAVYLHRALLETTRDGLELLLAQWTTLLPDSQRPLFGNEAPPNAGDQDAVARSREIVSGSLLRADSAALKKKLTDINQDVLGAYLFRRGEVQLYWMAIGLFAGIVGRPVKEVALIGLIHELAHAYTPLGLDIDKFEWNTDAFAESDLRIVEGLAQFYTEAVIDRLRARSSGLQSTFDALLALQSKAHTCHRDWAKVRCAQGDRAIVDAGDAEARDEGLREFMATVGHGGQLLDRTAHLDG